MLSFLINFSDDDLNKYLDCNSTNSALVICFQWSSTILLCFKPGIYLDPRSRRVNKIILANNGLVGEYLLLHYSTSILLPTAICRNTCLSFYNYWLLYFATYIYQSYNSILIHNAKLQIGSVICHDNFLSATQQPIIMIFTIRWFSKWWWLWLWQWQWYYWLFHWQIQLLDAAGSLPDDCFLALSRLAEIDLRDNKISGMSIRTYNHTTRCLTAIISIIRLM